MHVVIGYAMTLFFFFKQKTAYEIRPRDWSSDVCSSDLLGVQRLLFPTPAAPAQPVATMVRSQGARWDREGALPEGSRLLQGRLRLTEGRAAIQFDSGAVMLLSGPADLDLESRGRALLRSGKVTVEASEAYGFTVRTAAGEVVDLGTEFAVAVESTGATEVHVLQGEVSWTGRSS